MGRKARAAGVRLSASDDDEGSSMLLHAIVFLFFVLVGLTGYMYVTKKGPFAEECVEQVEVVDATDAPAELKGSDAEPKKTVPAPTPTRRRLGVSRLAQRLVRAE